VVYEVTRVQQWIFQRLHTTPTLAARVAERIYEAPAPQGATTPYVIVDHRAGTDTSSGRVRISTQMLFAIEVVTQDDGLLSLEPIYDAIDDALQGYTSEGQAYRGIIIDRVWRESNYADWGLESGQTRKHIGALWRLFIRPQVLNP